MGQGKLKVSECGQEENTITVQNLTHQNKRELQWEDVKRYQENVGLRESHQMKEQQ